MIRVAYRKSYADNFDAVFRKSSTAAGGAVVSRPLQGLCLKPLINEPVAVDPPDPSTVDVKAVLDHLIQSV